MWHPGLTFLAHADGAGRLEGVEDVGLELDAGLQEDGALPAGDVAHLRVAGGWMDLWLQILAL